MSIIHILRGDARSYIDHCLINRYMKESARECCILSDLVDCTSDHFPMSIKLDISVSRSQMVKTTGYVARHDPEHVKTAYINATQSNLRQMSQLIRPVKRCKYTLTLTVDDYGRHASGRGPGCW